MIYLQSDGTKINLIHYLPFHSIHGMKKTKEELELTGFFVESLPDRLVEVEQKAQVLFDNPLRWEYVDVPLTQEQKLQALVNAGKITQEEMNELL